MVQDSTFKIRLAKNCALIRLRNSRRFAISEIYVGRKKKSLRLLIDHEKRGIRLVTGKLAGGPHHPRARASKRRLRHSLEFLTRRARPGDPIRGSVGPDRIRPHFPSDMEPPAVAAARPGSIGIRFP